MINLLKITKEELSEIKWVSFNTLKNVNRFEKHKFAKKKRVILSL